MMIQTWKGDVMYTVYRGWVDGTKEHLLVLLTQDEAEEKCLVLNNTMLPRSHREYLYMYEAVIL